jgi:hypothetical protein
MSHGEIAKQCNQSNFRRITMYIKAREINIFRQLSSFTLALGLLMAATILAFAQEPNIENEPPFADEHQSLEEMGVDLRVEIAQPPFDDKLLSKEFHDLYDFLESYGYVIEESQTVYTPLTGSTYRLEQELHMDMAVTLFPFFTDDGKSARIVFWEGYWETAYYAGALATIGENEIYLSNGKEVFYVDRDSLPRYIEIPIYAIPGPIPPGLLESDYQVVQETPDLFGNNTQSGCWTAYRFRNGYTILGFLAWRFNVSKYFCYTGNSVYNINVTAYPSHMDPFFYYRGLVTAADYYITGGHHTLRQAHIENCILQYGCFWSGYPGIVSNVYNNGTEWGYTWE